MKLLLDTHVFIWWFNEPEKLSKKVLAACEDNKNELTLSLFLNRRTFAFFTKVVHFKFHQALLGQFNPIDHNEE